MHKSKKLDKGGCCDADPPVIMISLSWNCRGVGRPRKVQFLIDIVRQEHPDVIFLYETMEAKSKLEYVQSKLNFEGLFVVDLVGRSEGIALLWKEKD